MVVFYDILCEDMKERNNVEVDSSTRSVSTAEDSEERERVIERNGWPTRCDNGWREELERRWENYNRYEDPWWIYQQNQWLIAQYEDYLSNGEENKLESGW